MQPPPPPDPQAKSDGFLDLFPPAPSGRVARVVSDVALDKVFDYAIPASLAGALRPGHVVKAPFGRRTIRGIVLEIADHSEHPRLRELLGLAQAQPLVSEELIRLARWIAEYYCAPLESALRTVLPAAVRRPDAKFKERLFVIRGDAPPAAPAAPARLGPRQLEILAALAPGVAVPLADLLARFSVSAPTVRALERKGLVRVVRETVARDPLAHALYLHTEPHRLMEEQAAALARVLACADTRAPPVVLLHGITGSGKTEVYLQAIRHTLDQGRSAIMLVPEISLTPQTVDRFRGRFGREIAVLHSHLSDGERHDEWHRIRRGDARVVVGARSAVFAPVASLGLLVVDEEHEGSYKQDETPCYHARDVAIMRGRLCGAGVVLGSATPSFESFHNAEAGKFEHVPLVARVDNRSLPVIRVVDMAKEVGPKGEPRLFSSTLVDAVYLRLNRGEQVMLLMNRRGFATSLTCPACAHVVSCRFCSVPLAYHKAAGELRCHWCGAVEPVPAVCPACRDPKIRFGGIGTEKVEEQLAKLFPSAEVLRMDSDSMSRKDAHRQALQKFRTGKVDILVGTQMIAKGLDFPNVTLVGILNADATLNVPDFRAAERGFQLLTQMSGRAGRGEISGEVVVQTRNPGHPAILRALRTDYEGFYRHEMEMRRAGFYPPCSHLVVVTIRGFSAERALFSAEHLASRLRAALPEHVLLAGPQESPMARLRNQHRFQIVLRARTALLITRVARRLLQETKLPDDVHVHMDVDALSML